MQAVAEDITERHQEYSVQAMTNFVWGATTLGFFNEVQPGCCTANSMVCCLKITVGI